LFPALLIQKERNPTETGRAYPRKRGPARAHDEMKVMRRPPSGKAAEQSLQETEVGVEKKKRSITGGAARTFL